MLPCPRKAVAGFSHLLFLYAKNLIYYLCFTHLASPEHAALYPPLQAQRSGSLFLFSLDFQPDDGAAWTQGVKYLSWVNASTLVCLTSIHVGTTSLCRRRPAVRKGKLCLRQFLMPPFTSQPAGVGSCSQGGGTTCLHPHGGGDASQGLSGTWLLALGPLPRWTWKHHHAALPS